MLRSNSTQSIPQIHVVSTEEERYTVGRICRKGWFKPGMKDEWVMEYQ